MTGQALFPLSLNEDAFDEQALLGAQSGATLAQVRRRAAS